ncbi:unnamed protein product [Orchesella dallaii]|uniref:Bromo domain-containing protein n=1 Tax=Orchesella dallaii TaxID=48710 RepID=A0ABP1R5M4_9HEXA
MEAERNLMDEAAKQCCYRTCCMNRIKDVGPKSRQRSSKEPMTSTPRLRPSKTQQQIWITDSLVIMKEEILPALEELECAKYFLNPVDPKAFPDYSKFVKYPMDLSIIRRRLKYWYYLGLEQLEDDLKLIVANAGLYHGLGTEIYEASRNLLNTYIEKKANIPRGQRVIVVLERICEPRQRRTSERIKRKSEVLDTPEVTGKRMGTTKTQKKK